MTDAFADLVLPIFSNVLDLQDRLAWGEPHTLEQVKHLTKSWIEDSRHAAAADPELARSFELAEYGLVAWIDEVLTESEWGRSVDWGSEQHVLEWDLYGTHERANSFYDPFAKAAYVENDLDALEIYLLCVTLGFQGEFVYDEPRLAEWVQRVYDRVATAEVPERPFPIDKDLKNQFLPSRGPGLLLRTSILASITALVTLAAYLISVHLDFNSGS